MARPKGSKNTREIQTIAPSRCHNCKSTRRGLYTNRQVQEYGGLDRDGNPFTGIIRRRCQCLDCGQFRIDQTYWYQPGMPDADEALPDDDGADVADSELNSGFPNEDTAGQE